MSSPLQGLSDVEAKIVEAIKSGQITTSEYIKTLPPLPPAQHPSNPLAVCIGCDSRCYEELYFWMSGSDCFLCCPRCFQVLTSGLKHTKKYQHWRSGKHILPEASTSPPVSEPHLSQAPSSSPSSPPLSSSRVSAPVAQCPLQPSTTLIPGSPNGALHGVPSSQRLAGVGRVVEEQGSKSGGLASGDCGRRKKGKVKGKEKRKS